MNDDTTPPPEADRHPRAPHPRETAVLFGQETAEADFLAAAGSGRLHHAWLITGPRGVGKATLAWRIARWLVAGGADPTLDIDPGHGVFRQVRSLAAPGLALCRRPWDAKANRHRKEITVEEARAIKATLQLSAPDGAWRVAIIDAVDEMNTAAANALLKILEEPPTRTVLLLVSHRPSRLLPTIRSRCRALRCKPLLPEDLALALDAAGHPQAAGDARTLAALAGGSVGEALDLAAGDGIAIYGEIIHLLSRGAPLDRRGAVALAETCAGADRAERFRLVLRLLDRALARLALAGVGQPVAPLSETETALLARLAAGPAQGRLWAEQTEIIRSRAEAAYAVNLDPAQVILDTLLRIDAAAAQASRLAA
jgi:DNA polymerase III subunit delta'